MQNIKDGAYIINLDEYSDIRTHWVAFNVQNNDITYDSVMCGYFCIGFIDFVLAGKTEFTYLFSHNNFKRNDDIIVKHFITNV